jgi:hypothetical protein
MSWDKKPISKILSRRKAMLQMRRLIILLILILLFPMPVTAQADQELSSVRVRLWPEYDQPKVLVIYDLTLPAGTPLPATLSIRIPRSAGQPHAVASRQPNGSLVNLPYDPPMVVGDWIIIEFIATTLDSRLEYYDPALLKEGNARHYEFNWPGDYGVKSFEIEVQQPVDSSDMVLSPSMGGGVMGEDGLTYYGTQVGSLQKGQSFQQNIDYQKSTGTLSTELLHVEPVKPIDTSIGNSGTLGSVLPWILFLFGLLLLVGSGYWYLRLGRKSPKPLSRRRRKPASQQGSPSSSQRGGQDQKVVYCHQCGKRALSGDRFCRICGTQLRT